MLVPRILGIGLHALEGGLGADAPHLELGHEHGRLPRGARDEGDRPLRGEEAEAREVLDVLLVEEDVAGEPTARDVLQEPLAPLLELGGGDAGRPVLELHRVRAYCARS